MQNQLYCFSLYCESHGQTKSQAFATIRQTEEEARKQADLKNKGDFPPEQGWYNHQLSMLVVPKEEIILLAKEYEQENAS